MDDGRCCKNATAEDIIIIEAQEDELNPGIPKERLKPKVEDSIKSFDIQKARRHEKTHTKTWEKARNVEANDKVDELS